MRGSRLEAWMKSQVRGCYNITFICTPTRPGKQLHLTRYPLSFLHKPFSRSFICVSKSQLQQLTAVRHVSTLDACRGPVSGAEKCLVLTDVWCWPAPVVDRYLVLTDIWCWLMLLTDIWCWLMSVIDRCDSGLCCETVRWKLFTITVDQPRLLRHCISKNVLLFISYLLCFCKMYPN